MPVATWREMMERHYPNGGWVRLHDDTLAALSRRQRASAGCRPTTPASPTLLEEALTMDPALEELLGTLLYEGYALYPYTPGATKNATPTPFGIVYPPAYAQATPSTFDKLRMQGIARADGDAVLTGEVRFLQGAGRRPPGGAAPPRGARAHARRAGGRAARRALRARRPARARADVGRRPRRRAAGA